MEHSDHSINNRNYTQTENGTLRSFSKQQKSDIENKKQKTPDTNITEFKYQINTKHIV